MSHRKPLSMMQAQRLLFKINNPDINYEATKDDIEDLTEFMRNLVEAMKPIFKMLGDALMETLEAVQREFSWFLDLTPDEQAAVLKDIKAAQNLSMIDARSRGFSTEANSMPLGRVAKPDGPSGSMLFLHGDGSSTYATPTINIHDITTPEHSMQPEKLARKMREQGW